MRISDWSSDVCSSDLGRQRRAGEQLELAPARPLVLAALGAVAELGGQACDERAMQLHVPAGRVLTRHGRCLPRRQAKTHPTPRIFALQFQLPVQLAPLAHAQEAEEVAVAPLAQLRRSEEHTSELQSLMRISYAVFCLKKKTKHTPSNIKTTTT